LSLNICSAVAPIWRARLAAFINPDATPRWMPTGGAPAGQLNRRRGSRRATVRSMTDDGGLGPGEGGDLLSISLLVFFVALLLTVAGLLALPLIFD
jgi:hypothetical protein